MKIILAIIGFLAVSSNAASLGNGAVEEVVTAGTTPDSGEIHPGELDEFTSQGDQDLLTKSAVARSNAVQVPANLNNLTDVQTATNGVTDVQTATNGVTDVQSATNGVTDVQTATKPIDFLSFPLSLFIRLIGKEALKNFDITTICDAIQVIDWQAYKDMLMNEDYEGLKEKLTKDEIISAFSETFETSLRKYFKIISNGDASGLENSFKDVQKVISLDKKPATPCGIEKTMKDWLNLILSEKTIPKEGLEFMQKYTKIVQDTFQGKRLFNSLDLSQKDNIEKASIGKGV